MMRVESWNELLCEIKRFKSEMPEKREVWFRGQGNSSFVLLPSLLRVNGGLEKERDIFYTYKKLSQRLAITTKDNWETLFNMQHYFIPTRLLDWSENLGVALYFAISGNKDEGDISLYLLDPLELNTYTKKDGIPIIPDENMGLDYIENYLKKIPFSPRFPIAIRPNFINDRMLAQRGLFTVHGDDLTEIEVLCPKAVKKFIIAHDVIEEIKEFLEIANINEYTVFPDINGISYYIRNMLNN